MKNTRTNIFKGPVSHSCTRLARLSFFMSYLFVVFIEYVDIFKRSMWIINSHTCRFLNRMTMYNSFCMTRNITSRSDIFAHCHWLCLCFPYLRAYCKYRNSTITAIARNRIHVWYIISSCLSMMPCRTRQYFHFEL